MGSKTQGQYGVIVDEKGFDNGGKNDSNTKSVGHKGKFTSDRDAFEHYNKKWSGQEFYLVKWDGKEWREIS